MTISLDSLFLENRTVISSHPGLAPPSPPGPGSRGAARPWSAPPSGGGGGQALILVTGRNTNRLVVGVFLLTLPSYALAGVVAVVVQVPDGPWW